MPKLHSSLLPTFNIFPPYTDIPDKTNIHWICLKIFRKKAHVHVSKLRPCLAPYEQTEWENIKKAHSRQETGKPGGTRRVMSEHFVITTTDARHGEWVSWIKTHQSWIHFVMGERFCVNEGKDRGLAGRRFIKPSLPNAANSTAHPGKKDEKKICLNIWEKNVTGVHSGYVHCPKLTFSSKLQLNPKRQESDNKKNLFQKFWFCLSVPKGVRSSLLRIKATYQPGSVGVNVSTQQCQFVWIQASSANMTTVWELESKIKKNQNP